MFLRDCLQGFPRLMDSAREAFGDVLKAWFARNKWPQSITETWAKSCGSPGPWASQISPAINYKLDPKAAFFVALGNFNTAVAERNVLSVTNERVRQLLLKGEPLCHDDGVPFGPDDFFKLFVGMIQPPAEVLPEPPENCWACTPDGGERLEVITRQAREAFADIGGRLMVAPAELWQKVRPSIAEYLSDEQMSHMQRMLSGYETMRPDVPGAHHDHGIPRCMLCTALERVAPQETKESQAFQRLDSETKAAIKEHLQHA